MTADMFLRNHEFQIVGKIIDPETKDPLPILRVESEKSTLNIFVDDASIAALRKALDVLSPPLPSPPPEVLDEYAEEHASEFANEVSA